jgi:hypothetical protein
MNEFIQNVVSGIIGGMFVLVVQKVLDIREKKNQDEKLRLEKLTEQEQNRVIDPVRNHKYVHAEIANSILPGSSIAKMKEVLGIAESHYKGYISVFGEELLESYVYYYEFLNARIVITSADDNMISSMTIESKLVPAHPIRCIYPFSEDDAPNLGELKVTEDMIERCENVVADFTARDAWFALEVYYGRIGRYYQYTFFGSEVERIQEYHANNDSNVFLNSIIYSFCISSSQRSAYYLGVV